MTDIKIEIPKGSPANSGNNNTPAEDSTPSADQTQAELEAKEKAALEAELEAPYFEKKTVVISSVRNYSAYRRINMQALGKPKATIGSSVKSVRILMSDKGELLIIQRLLVLLLIIQTSLLELKVILITFSLMLMMEIRNLIFLSIIIIKEIISLLKLRKIKFLQLMKR